MDTTRARHAVLGCGHDEVTGTIWGVILLLAVALVALVVVGSAGVVALGAWEARTAATAPRRAPLLVLWDEQVTARRPRTAVPVAAGRAVVARPARALRAALVDG